jgi:tetratricopeptide (TPR) repeat protein
MYHMFLWLWGLVALLVMGSGCSRPEDYLERGKRASVRGDQAEAILDFRKAIQKNPQFANAFQQLAHSQTRSGDLSGALASLERALQLRPNDDSLRAEVGDTALAIYLADPRRPRIRYDQVAKVSRELLAKNPHSFDGLRFQASLLYTDNQLAAAIQVFRQANALKPMMPGVILPLADALWKSGQTAEAEGLARELARQHKDYLQSYNWLYELYQNTHRPAQAEAILVEKAANNPSSSASILQLAAHYQQAGQPTEMVATLNRLLERPKDFPNRFLQVGDFYVGIRSWDQAGQWFQRGIREDSKNARVYRTRLVTVYVNEQKRSQALDLAGQLIREAPKDWALRAQRAEIWLAGAGPSNSNDKQDAVKAIGEYQTLVKELPRDPRVRFLLGRAYFLNGDRGSAAQAFAQAAAQQRQYLDPRIALAGLDRQTQNFKETLRLADEILAVDPHNFSGRLLHASGSRGLGNLDVAEQELEALAREAPESPDVHLELGLVTLARKQYTAAERTFSNLYQSNQSDVRSLAGLAAVYMAQGQGDRALQVVTREVNRVPRSLEMRELLAAIALNAGRKDIALEQYQKLTGMAPDNARYLVSLAELFREKNDYAGEVTALEKAGHLAPDNAVVAGRLAMAEDLSGNKKQAAAEYQRSLDMAPSDPALLNNRAYFMAEDGGNLDQALEYSQAAVRKVPDNPDLLDTLAWVYTKRKMNDSAIEILDKLVRQNPDRSSFHYHLGTALAQKGDKARAKSELAVALSKKPAPDEEEKIRDLMGKLP